MILDEGDLNKKDIKNTQFYNKVLELSKKYMDVLPANYMFFCIENKITKERLGFSTNAEWQKYYIEKQLINHCPLYLTMLKLLKRTKLNSFLFPWNKIIPEDEKQRELMGFRREIGIGNGISLTKRNGIYEVILGLATVPKDHGFEKNYVSFMPTIISLLVESSELCVEFEKSSVYKSDLLILSC